MTYSLVTPPLIQTPFATNANSALITNAGTLPLAAPANTGGACWAIGYDPLNFQAPPPLGNGIPISGPDTQALLYSITAHLQNLNAGQRYKFSSTLASAIGGYPVGTILQSNDGMTEYLCVSAANTNDPNSNLTGWRPYISGSIYTSVTASTTTLTLTNSQAFSRIINVGGVSTTVIVPTSAGSWVFNNSTSGTVTIQASGSSGTTVAIPQGTALPVYCDGALSNPNIVQVGQIVNFSTNAQTQAGSSSIVAVTPSSLASAMIGAAGSSWSSQTSNISPNTVYQNASGASWFTGRPILISASNTDTSSASVVCQILVGTTSSPAIVAASAKFDPNGEYVGIFTLNAIIPNGYYFKISLSGATTLSNVSVLS